MEERQHNQPIHIPDLQRPRSQHPRPLILGHIRRCTPLLLRDLLFLQSHHGVLLPRASRAGILSHLDNAVGAVEVAVQGIIVESGRMVTGVSGISAGAVVNGLLVSKVGFIGLIVVDATLGG